MAVTLDERAAGPERSISAFEEIRRRFRRFPNSGLIDPRVSDFDPRYGVPPRPPAGAAARLRETWDQMFGSPLFMHRFEVTEELLEKPAPAIRRREIDVIDLPGSVQDSRNWAGAYATAYGGEHFHTMFGFWQIPPVVTIPAGENPCNYACSTWIGLDGQRRYFDSSLPQIGTSSKFGATGESLASAWVQWWERDDPNNQVLPLDLPVAPGDRIGCFLHATSLHHAWFAMVNMSAKAPKPAFAFCAVSPDPISGPIPPPSPPFCTVSPEPTSGVRPAIFGATAEWIVERPSIPHTTTQYKLPDFQRCNIDGFALQVRAIGQGPWYGGTLRDMSYARTIRMIEQRSNPSRTAIIAMPHRPGPGGVEVTYGGF